MPASNHDATSTLDREIVLTRLFEAPREILFDAWTDPIHIADWWGPRGFTTTVHEMDVRPGGVWRFTMHGPDGVDYPNEVVYHEIVRPERLVYTHGSGEADDPGRFEVTLTFTDRAGSTELTMRSLMLTAEARDHAVGFGAIELGYQTLDRLAEFVAAH